MTENMQMLNSLASDLHELSTSSYKFESVLDKGDTKLILEFLDYYQDFLNELQEGIQYLKENLEENKSRICEEEVLEYI